MTLITTSGRAKRYALLRDGELVASGELCGTDHLATSLSVVADEDENAFLAAVPANALPPLPPQGTWLEAGDLYANGARVVMVRRDHSRTEHAVDDLVPTLFLVYRADASDVLAWVAGENVVKGTRRTYDGVTYQCVIAHTTQVDWTPVATLGVLWAEVATEPAGAEWQAGIVYSVDDVVSYGGTEYTCIQGHTSQVGWEPDVAASLWTAVPEEPAGNEWAAGVSYTIGDVVTYDGAEYECRQSHTSLVGWEPPNVLALWLPL